MATELLINVTGAVALLLWGLRLVRTGVTRAFGASLREALLAGTRNRVRAFLVGIGVTAILQSSMATTLIVSSFAGQGLIAALPALAVMLGADVGSTLVAQVFSLRIDWLSPVLIAVGVFTFLSSERSKRRSFGRILLGLGLMLLSIKLIVLGSAGLRESPTLAYVLEPLVNEPLLAVLIGGLLTWLAHSSVAMVLLVMSLVTNQAIPLDLGFMLVLGANIGGACAPIVATLGAPRTARLLPIGNCLMRVVGVLAILAFVPYLQPWLAVLEDDPARMLVNFHTAFNLLLALLFLPIIGLVVKLTGFLLPESESEDYNAAAPRHLDTNALDNPAVALSNAARETLRMGDTVETMLKQTLEVFRHNDDGLLTHIEKSDDQVDSLHEAIKTYLISLTQNEMDVEESRRTVAILSFTTNLEHIGDIIDKNLLELARKKIRNHCSFSPEGFNELAEFHQLVTRNLQLALSVFISGDSELARRLLLEKVNVRNQEQALIARHFKRMGAGTLESIHTSSLHLDVLRDLKRINSHITSVAYPILEQQGLLTDSRLVDRSSKKGASAEVQSVLG